MIFYRNFIKITIFLGLFTATAHMATAKNHYLDENFTVNIRKNQDNLVAKFQDWSVYKVKSPDRTVCYILSSPITKGGNRFKRAKSYFLVNNLINDADEVTIISGYYFKETVDVEISIGRKKFYLFPHKSHAWAYDKNDDLNIIKAMQLNPEFTINAFSKRNKNSIDRYSLIGFKHAYFKMKEICKK